MDRESYTFEDWCADVEAIRLLAAESRLISEQSILGYTRGKYPKSEAAEKGRCLCILASFAHCFGQEMDQAGLVRSDGLIPGLPRAIYRWLVLMPWEGQAPLPPKEEIFRMLRGDV